MARAGRIDRQLQALAQLGSGPEAVAVLRATLATGASFAAARAARLVQDRGLDELAPDLVAAFSRFLVDPVRSDPGCFAKQAIADALDFLDRADAELLLLAARHEQQEPAFPEAVDTAIGVRARGLVALARLGQPDFPLVGGEALGDPAHSVRAAAADALAIHGDRSAAAALLLKLRLGDAEAGVITACMAALLSLAPAVALPRLAAALATDDFESACLALAQSHRDDALDVLLACIADTALATRRAVAVRVLGLHRSDRARTHLLATLATGSLADASAAMEALAITRFDPAVRTRVEAAVAARPELRADFAAHFRDD